MTGASMTTCRICGLDIREKDDVVVIDDDRWHAACVDAPTTTPRRRVGGWAAFGSKGQMAMGDTQREHPTK